MVKNKALTFAPAFKTKKVRKFFDILINNTSSTRNTRTVNTYNIGIKKIDVNKLYGILNRARTILYG